MLCSVNRVGVPGEAGERAIAQEAVRHIDGVDEALRYIISAIFSTFQRW